MSGSTGFMAKFAFRPEGAGLIGTEREGFITDPAGNIVPWAPRILEHLPDRKSFGYELSACQLEDRVGPVDIQDLLPAFMANERMLARAEKILGFKRLYIDVAPENMPLDIFPDPTGRYQLITANMPLHILSAACRVAGIHFHVGMPDHTTALRVYNGVIKNCERLCQMGDKSGGKRLAIYQMMAPDYMPQPYESWAHFHEIARAKGFEEDPRKCWCYIRISVHGTIEFRMFGSTDDLKEILAWAKECHKLCIALF